MVIGRSGFNFHVFSPAGHDVLSTEVSALKIGIVLLALVFGVIVQRKLPVWDRAPCVPATAKMAGIRFASTVDRSDTRGT